MTTDQLQQLANDYLDSAHSAVLNQGLTSKQLTLAWLVSNNAYQDGFKQALELVGTSVAGNSSLPSALVKLLKEMNVDIVWGD